MRSGDQPSGWMLGTAGPVACAKWVFARAMNVPRKIGDGQDDVEILVHVAVMQQVVAVEPAEPPGFFDPPRLWQVHAPVDVFVKTVVGGEGDARRRARTPIGR